MKRRNLIQLAVASAGLSIAGVPLSLFAATKKDSVVNVLLQPEPPGLVSGILQNAPVQLVAGNIFESLLRYDEKLNPMPSLAASWTVNKESSLFVFKLKPNVSWHDGKPFTAADVVFSADVFLRKMHPRFRATLEHLESVRAIDPLTVEFKLKYSFAPFIGIFESGSMPIVAKHIYEGTDFATNPANLAPIGTGPFKFKEWVKGSHILLVANDKYHIAGAPEIASLYFHVIPDAAARAAAFESGKIDVVPGGAVEYFDVARLAKLPGAQVSTKGWEFFAPQSWLWLNNTKGVMGNVKSRQAMMYAIDREAMARIAWQGYAKPSTGPLNHSLKFYSTDTTKYPRDVAKAKALLAEAGYKGETLKILPLPYGETWNRQAEILRQNLAQVGVKTEITATDVAGWNQRLNERDYEIAFTYLFQYGDPALGVFRTYTTANMIKGSPWNNVEGYSNPKIDELFAAGGREPDTEKRRLIYLEIQKILVDDVPVAWLHDISFPTLYRTTKIGNPISSAIGLNDSLGRATVA